MINRISFITIFLCILLIGCKKAGPTQPQDSKVKIDLMMNGSFEINGIPTTENWTLAWPPYSFIYQYIRYSNDIPPNGGQWSVVVDSLYKQSIRIATYVDLHNVNHIYKLSFWAKNQDLDASVMLGVTGRGLKITSGQTIAVTDSNWKKYTISSEDFSSLYQEVPDSIRVFEISIWIANGQNKYGKANFDNFELEQMD